MTTDESRQVVADGCWPARPAPQVSVQTAADVAAEPVRWLWNEHLALGKIAMVAGAANAGKSMLVAGDFAARVSTGAPWPDGTSCLVGDVLIASGHDGAADTLVPRLRDHGADLKRVHFLDGRIAGGPEAAVARLLTAGGLPILEAALQRRPGVKLVVIDPVSAFVDAGGNAARSWALLPLLRDMAERCGAAFILVAGLREGAAKAPAAIGPAGLVSAARCVWVLSRDPDDPQRRLFMPVKNNLGAECFGYAWRLASRKVQWETERVGPTAGDGPLADHRGRARARREAAAFIADFLTDGPRMWAVIEFNARLAGHKSASLERARGGVAEAFKRQAQDGRWLWRLIGDDRTSSPGDIEDYFGGGPIGPRASGRTGRRWPQRVAAEIEDVADDEDAV